MRSHYTRWMICGLISLSASTSLVAQNTRETESYEHLKEFLDGVPAIDTHDHVRPFDLHYGFNVTADGPGMNLAALWKNSYYPQIGKLTPWKDGMQFSDWWKVAKHDFNNTRAGSFYRYQLPAFKDLYRIDFDHISDDQARELDQKIFENYKDPRWLYEVITERANIELMVNDPYWNRLGFVSGYPFEVKVFNVTQLIRGFHESEFTVESDNAYLFAKKHGLPVDSLDDYLKVLDRLFVEAKDQGVVCLKSAIAYNRTLKFEKVTREQADRAFGKRATMLTAQEIKDFEDFIMWRLCELSAKYELPFQIHTGHGRLQGSNPMNLLDMIEANPKTKFILFHGGFPWVGETGAILMRHSGHVWLDSVWMPTLSYTMAKRAYHEWLEVMPSNRIMWGADCVHAEGVYGATQSTRMCLAEVLAEKVDRGDLTMGQAEQIGRQIMRENALELFPQLKERLWKHKGIKLEPPAK